MLDKVVSFSLNTEVGLFIFLMLRTSRSERFKWVKACVHLMPIRPASPFLSVSRHLTVPLPASERLFRLHWLLPIYFMFAVAYDVFQSILEITETVALLLRTNSSLGWEWLDIRWNNICCWGLEGTDSYYLTSHCASDPNNTHNTHWSQNQPKLHPRYCTSIDHKCSLGKKAPRSRKLRLFLYLPTSI